MLVDKVSRTYTMLSSDDVLALDKFVITNIKISIVAPFDTSISVYLKDEILLDDDEIIENEIAVTSYDTVINISTEKNISFNLGAATEGDALLIITGYAV